MPDILNLIKMIADNNPIVIGILMAMIIGGFIFLAIHLISKGESQDNSASNG